MWPMWFIKKTQDENNHRIHPDYYYIDWFQCS